MPHTKASAPYTPRDGSHVCVVTNEKPVARMLGHAIRATDAATPMRTSPSAPAAPAPSAPKVRSAEPDLPRPAKRSERVM